MQVYDKAHELANEIKKCEEYKRYIELKDKVMAKEAIRPLLNDYKKLQLQAQAAMISGSEPSKELMDKIKKLGEVLAFDSDVTEFFTAEYKFQTLVSDIYNIIGDACDLGLDIMKE